jgi:hypothetical protein
VNGLPPFDNCRDERRIGGREHTATALSSCDD